TNHYVEDIYDESILPEIPSPPSTEDKEDLKDATVVHHGSWCSNQEGITTKIPTKINPHSCLICVNDILESSSKTNLMLLISLTNS
ncbi:hypothetical protein LINGRAHAP2_LOCUS32568, partial [Linum grandiflorum]